MFEYEPTMGRSLDRAPRAGEDRHLLQVAAMNPLETLRQLRPWLIFSVGSASYWPCSRSYSAVCSRCRRIVSPQTAALMVDRIADRAIATPASD
jgi:hypothetical protein